MRTWGVGHWGIATLETGTLGYLFVNYEAGELSNWEAETLRHWDIWLLKYLTCTTFGDWETTWLKKLNLTLGHFGIGKYDIGKLSDLKATMLVRCGIVTLGH